MPPRKVLKNSLPRLNLEVALMENYKTECCVSAAWPLLVSNVAKEATLHGK